MSKFLAMCQEEEIARLRRERDELHRQLHAVAATVALNSGGSWYLTDSDILLARNVTVNSRRDETTRSWLFQATVNTPPVEGAKCPTK